MMTENQKFQVLELRNLKNDNLASFPNCEFTLVNKGTSDCVYPEMAENLIISISRSIKKPKDDFNIEGSKIKFKKEISETPEFIFFKQKEDDDEVYFDLEPDPSCLIESIRNIGYTLETAIADIIDNSISALANNIYINIKFNDKNNGFVIEIIDDGIGMNKQQCVMAMRVGSKNPTNSRDINDLGRFGLGLKTASFSQCRSLTVETYSKEYNEKNSFTWDLDKLRECGKWKIKKNDPPKINIGTKIIWEKLDKWGIELENIQDDQKKVKKIQLKIGETASKIEKHISLIFHRFIDAKSIDKNIRQIQIFLNERKIKPFNPFNESNNATFISPITEIPSSSMKINYFILPHKDKCKDREYEEYAGEDGYLESQGFYVYRNYRLITWGTWFKIMEKLNAYRLCRVRIDIGNDMDFRWKIDVKKSNANPPKAIRDFLEEYVRKVQIKGQKLTDGKIAKFSTDDNLKIWVSDKIKRTKITEFKINRKNPLIKKIIKNIDSGLEIIKEIEASVPYDLINLHVNDTKQKFQSTYNPNRQEFIDRCIFLTSNYRKDNIDDDTIKKMCLELAERKGMEISSEDIKLILK
tara:strand:+ start:3654 stop:5399 length:1746 start_codon:yes stop_codon:yes gene_type:complete